MGLLFVLRTGKQRRPFRQVCSVMRWFVSAAMVEGAVSASRVRGLYKMCLRLHRSLPPAMRSIGDAYVN